MKAEEFLSPFSSFKPNLAAFLLSCRSMGLLDQVVMAGIRHNLDVLHRVEQREFPKRCTVTPELVSVNDFWRSMFPLQPVEERFGGFSITVFLQEDVQHGSVFVNSPP